jgi:hypothetical protein
MPTITLDEFVEGLRTSVMQAQSNIDRGNRGRLERLVALARDGRTEALTWSFAIDRPGDIGGTHTVRLPLITLFPPIAAQLREMTLELDVSIAKTADPRKVAAQKCLQLLIGRYPASLRQRLHRLTVRLTGTQRVRADVSLDGVLFKTLGVDARPSQPAARQAV